MFKPFVSIIIHQNSCFSKVWDPPKLQLGIPKFAEFPQLEPAYMFERVSPGQAMKCVVPKFGAQISNAKSTERGDVVVQALNVIKSFLVIVRRQVPLGIMSDMRTDEQMSSCG